MSPMHKLLTHLIDEGDEDGVPVQIQFQLGQPSAGGLRKGPVDGIFEFTTVADPGPNAPAEVKAMGQVVIHQYFEPASVAQVIVQDRGGIEAPGNKRIITGLHS